MECVDPEPHPVDHSTMNFMVDLDGDDFTAQYCEELGGNMTEDGWCHLDKDKQVIYFGEESEHNLKYQCVDALGNIGPVDDEKFKVEGTSFQIDLNKKWNLVSVPFVLQDSNIMKVWESIDGNVDAIWAYDSILGWQVYRPSSPQTSNLDTMDPGRGYWVSMLKNDKLVIGGALFSPAVTPPSWPIVPGWNLIGYYGNDGLFTPPLQTKTVYDGPDTDFTEGSGRTAGCSLYSLGDSFLDKGWTSLLGYWQPYNPNLWQGYSYYDTLDAGAGYWVSTAETGVYEFTTNCGILAS